MAFMKKIGRRLFRTLMGRTPLQYWPVRVRDGLAKGASWTAFPFSSNWRLGGERDVEEGFKLLNSKAGAVCWDLGAHFGIHSIGFARQVGSEGQVCAFEPDPVAFRRLTRHVQMNHLENVKLFNHAASNRDGELRMIISSGLGSTVTHAPYEEETISGDTEFLKAQSVRLDTLVRGGQIRPPDFMKVDVEGHGAKAIEGAIETIALSKPAILLSVHSSQEWDGARRLLQPLGYEPRTCDGNAIDWVGKSGLRVVLLTASH